MSHLRACAITVMIAINTVFWGLPIHLLALVKLLAWRSSWKKACAGALMRAVQGWIGGVLLVQDHFLPINWDIQGTDDLHRDKWYIVICNHRTWADIPALLKALTHRTPFPVVFAKRQMFWVPIIGTAIWAMDFPIMKRYSKQYLARHPEKRGKDLETTRKSCRKYHFTPVTVLNFIEGTRFRLEKHRRQNSPFRHLLRPKAGGLAFTIEAMENRITRMLDATIVYPEGITNFWSYLGGNVRHISVHIREIAIPDPLLRGSYADDPEFRETFQKWIRQEWQEKDALIDRLLKRQAQPSRFPGD